MKHRWISMVLLTALALTSCGSPQPTEAGQELEPMEPKAPAPTSSVVEVSPLSTFTPAADSQPILNLSDPALKALIAKSMDDLAQRFSIPAEQITLQEAIEVTWPDSSLGCKDSTLEYLQVITPGYLLRFQAMDKIYEYHTDKMNTILYCEDPSLAPPGSLPDK